MIRALLVAALALTGCASTPGGERAERLITQGAVLAYIRDGAQPAVRAQRVVDAVALVKTQLLDTSATVGTLRSALLARVNERGLTDPGEQVLALEVVNSIADATEKNVGDGMLSPAAVVKINDVLMWAESVARLYVPQ